MKFGDEQVSGFDLSCLKVFSICICLLYLYLQVLGTVGEPINPEAWVWYHKVVGQGRCSISDTYWQTETGYGKNTNITGLGDATTQVGQHTH